MHEGAIEQAGTSQEIYNEPATPFVASFVGSANVIRGLVIGDSVQFGQQLVAGADGLPEGALAHAYVRPHDVNVYMQSMNGSTTTAIVERLNDLGWISKLHLRLDDDQAISAQLPNEQLIGIDEGMKVWVDLQNAKVFPSGRPVSSDELAAG
jgi:sulfate transport system ATP-binding protein